MDNNPNVRMRGDGEIIVKDNEDLKFEIGLNAVDDSVKTWNYIYKN